MALVNCPDCRKLVSDKAAICPNCGGPIESFVGELPRPAVDPVQRLPVERPLGGEVPELPRPGRADPIDLVEEWERQEREERSGEQAAKQAEAAPLFADDGGFDPAPASPWDAPRESAPEAKAPVGNTGSWVPAAANDDDWEEAAPTLPDPPSLLPVLLLGSAMAALWFGWYGLAASPQGSPGPPPVATVAATPAESDPGEVEPVENDVEWIEPAPRRVATPRLRPTRAPAAAPMQRRPGGEATRPAAANTAPAGAWEACRERVEGRLGGSSNVAIPRAATTSDRLGPERWRLSAGMIYDDGGRFRRIAIDCVSAGRGSAWRVESLDFGS